MSLLDDMMSLFRPQRPTPFGMFELVKRFLPGANPRGVSPEIDTRQNKALQDWLVLRGERASLPVPPGHGSGQTFSSFFRPPVAPWGVTAPGWRRGAEEEPDLDVKAQLSGEAGGLMDMADGRRVPSRRSRHDWFDEVRGQDSGADYWTDQQAVRPWWQEEDDTFASLRPPARRIGTTTPGFRPWA